jgi:apolipoprotein N-acyltransferase
VEAAGTTDVRVAAVQPYIDEGMKFDGQHAKQIQETYDGLTRTALGWHPQLLLWPEAATLDDLYDAEMLDYLRGLVPEGGSFLLGSFLETPAAGEYNIAACLGDGGKRVEVYRKMHLVPFGEYLPLRKEFPLFAMIAGALVPSDLSAGHEFTLFNVQGLKAAPLICFEDTLGDQTRRFVSRGAQLLVNITNDAWFGTSAGCEQHLANARFRAVETRRPLVRDANTGVTCIIDCEGRVTDALRDTEGRPFLQGVLFGVVRVPKVAPVTFYTRLGDWPAKASGLVALGCLAAGVIKKRRQ